MHLSCVVFSPSTTLYVSIPAVACHKAKILLSRCVRPSVRPPSVHPGHILCDVLFATCRSLSLSLSVPHNTYCGRRRVGKRSREHRSAAISSNAAAAVVVPDEMTNMKLRTGERNGTGEGEGGDRRRDRALDSPPASYLYLCRSAFCLLWVIMAMERGEQGERRERGARKRHSKNWHFNPGAMRRFATDSLMGSCKFSLFLGHRRRFLTPSARTNPRLKINALR